VNSSTFTTHVRNWGSLLVALALGPTFIVFGYQGHALVFRAAAGAWILLCAFVVPALAIVAGRFKFLAWQAAIISITLSVIWDNLRLNALQQNDILSLVFVSWAGGSLLSAPVPIYFALRALSPRQRYIVGAVIAVVALLLWLSIKTITR
jgi:uncharacterized membrane protein